MKRVNEEEDIEGAFVCSANFVGGQVDFRSVRPFVRPFIRSFVRPSHFRFTLALKL